MKVLEQVRCFHCGQPCETEMVKAAGQTFCCFGCKVVYEIIQENDLCEYYSITDFPGTRRVTNDTSYDFLDALAIRRKLLDFDSAQFAKVKFFVPTVHCASCIWLLESLQAVDPGIIRSEVNLSQKTVQIDFNPEKIALSRVASLLASLGYSPQVNADSGNQPATTNRGLLIRLGVAGFCFGNVMLFSFPEYLGLDTKGQPLGTVFSFLNLALSLPVLLFSASDYFRSAWKSFAQKQITVDVPIVLGFVALFGRSAWDILAGTGPGYLDSFTGLVFFLLIGRWFQEKTYQSLSFDRDYRAFFPLAIQRKEGETWKSVEITELRKGDQIRARNLEIVPTDSMLLDKEALVDYSFVTGEASPVHVKISDTVLAGGRIVGASVKLLVEKPTSRSYLTQLWNSAAFKKKHESGYRRVIDKSARIFTWIVMGIALVTFLYWHEVEPASQWLVLTAVLMVACPCALALAAPFTYGSVVRVFGLNKFYLKNADVVERLGAIDSIIFDKTGTITHGGTQQVTVHGSFTSSELNAVKSLTGNSTHPLSALIHNSISGEISTVSEFTEMAGQGIEGVVGGHTYKIGSPAFVRHYPQDAGGTCVMVSVDGALRGHFEICSRLRDIGPMVASLGPRDLFVVSGDNSQDEPRMRSVFPEGTEMHFNQDPEGKLDFIRFQQVIGKKVLMIGDGLNDAGALKGADVGVAVSDSAGLFTPACDGILDGGRLADLNRFLAVARSARTILLSAFTISFLYNSIALGIAVTGNLSPLVAAILMPLSSASVVGFSSLAVRFVAKRQKLNLTIES